MTEREAEHGKLDSSDKLLFRGGRRSWRDYCEMYRTLQHVAQQQDEDSRLDWDHLECCRVREHSDQTQRGLDPATGLPASWHWNV